MIKIVLKIVTSCPNILIVSLWSTARGEREKQVNDSLLMTIVCSRILFEEAVPNSIAIQTNMRNI